MNFITPKHTSIIKPERNARTLSKRERKSHLLYKQGTVSWTMNFIYWWSTSRKVLSSHVLSHNMRRPPSKQHSWTTSDSYPELELGSYSSWAVTFHYLKEWLIPECQVLPEGYWSMISHICSVTICYITVVWWIFYPFSRGRHCLDCFWVSEWANTALNGRWIIHWYLYDPPWTKHRFLCISQLYKHITEAFCCFIVPCHSYLIHTQKGLCCYTYLRLFLSDGFSHFWPSFSIYIYIYIYILYFLNTFSEFFLSAHFPLRVHLNKLHFLFPGSSKET